MVVLATLLLYAGHPPHPSAPPAPLQLPPPGQDPGVCSGTVYGMLGCEVWDGDGAAAEAVGEVPVVWRGLSDGATELGRLKLEGRGALRVF